MIRSPLQMPRVGLLGLQAGRRGTQTTVTNPIISSLSHILQESGFSFLTEEGSFFLDENALINENLLLLEGGDFYLFENSDYVELEV